MRKNHTYIIILILVSLFISCQNTHNKLLQDKNGFIKFVVVIREPDNLLVTDRSLSSKDKTVVYHDLLEKDITCYFDADSNLYFQPREDYEPVLMMWAICSDHGID
ncbi:MAG: hypothetical protein MUC87_22505 [Bacteroidia bacterium]|jgi:hypothetical protein|nr:hypothetical protein [Bacteroidia bacterium]